jgi:hypothetical protein
MECRKSVKDLTAGEKTAYVNALLALKTAPSLIPAAATAVTNGGGTPNRYDDYVYMHNVVGTGAHRGSAFGPWHREFLRQLELDLRAVSGNPHLSIPYWDWTVDRTPVSAGWPFTNDFMGGFGTTSPASFLVTSGPFSNPATWRINIRRAGDGDVTLKRSQGVPGPGTLPSRTGTVLPGLGIGIWDVLPYNGNPPSDPATRTAQANAAFRKYIEWLLHDGIHVWIGGINAAQTDGGHMTFPSVAVNDPIFFLHHANVDRLWTIWQQLHPAAGYEPAAGANAGHNLNDVMAQFSNSAFFNFPLQSHPADHLDWHADNVWYRSDLPAITPVSPSVNFGNVPENLTTYRPVQFEVRTCQPVKFRITGVGGTNFAVPATQGTVVVDHSETLDPVTANVYLQFQALGALGTPQAGSATIEAYIDDADGYFAATVGGEFVVGTWSVNLTATPVAKPRAAVVFVLDRSGSMAIGAGPAGTRYDLLKSSLQATADVMADNDAIGLVSYDDLVATLAPVTQMGAAPGGTGRTAVSNAISSGDLAPRGLTAIGSGMIQGASVLDAERTNPATPYTRFAMVVMTDGNQNVAPLVGSPPVSAAIASFSDSVYAVGLGDVGGVSASTLGAIASYMLITGDITSAEQRFRLAKYFIQILASVTNTAIVVDPQGDLHVGVEHRIPFDLTEADASVDVIALSPAAFLLDFRLEAPDGTTIVPGSSPNVLFRSAQDDAFYRVGLPAVPGSTGTHGGRWHAVFSVSRQGGLQTHGLDAGNVAAVLRKTGTLPYSLVVQAYSNIAFEVEVNPAVARPGESLALYARLTEYDVPVHGRARVVVEVTAPGGAVTQVPLTETTPGTFGGSAPTAGRGVYVCRFRARGTSLGGRTFTREETRTAAVFVPPPDGATDGSGLGDALDENRRRLCALLECLVREDGLARPLERLGLDRETLLRCLRQYCKSRPHGD